MIPQNESLLKYENPVLISSGKDKDKKGAKTLRKVRDGSKARSSARSPGRRHQRTAPDAGHPAPGGAARGRDADGGHPQLHPASQVGACAPAGTPPTHPRVGRQGARNAPRLRPQGVDGGWPAVGAVRLEHARHAPRRDQPAGAAGPAAAAAAGARHEALHPHVSLADARPQPPQLGLQQPPGAAAAGAADRSPRPPPCRRARRASAPSARSCTRSASTSSSAR
jgi:hypothetical protein